MLLFLERESNFLDNKLFCYCFFGSASSDRNLRRVNSVHGKMRTAEISEASTSHSNLKRSKSDGQIQVPDDPATELLDDKASAKEEV